SLGERRALEPADLRLPGHGGWSSACPQPERARGLLLAARRPDPRLAPFLQHARRSRAPAGEPARDRRLTEPPRRTPWPDPSSTPPAPRAWGPRRGSPPSSSANPRFSPMRGG